TFVRQNRPQHRPALLGNRADANRGRRRPIGRSGTSLYRNHSEPRPAQLPEHHGEATMKQTTTMLLFGALLLLAFSSTTTAQTKARNRTTKPAAKPITITLVRWPYT